MSNPIYVRRQGNVATVFIDVATEQPLRIANFDDEPVGGFPLTMKTAEVPHRFPGRQIVWVDQARPPQPESTYTPTEQEIQALVQGKGLGMPPTVVQHPEPPPSNPLLEKVVSEFKSLILSWKAGNDMEAKRDAEAVLTFLIAVEPQLEETLRLLAAEEPATKRRVTL